MLFVYLFFYVCLGFWADTSFRLKHTDFLLVELLWEEYYAVPDVIYVNLTEQEEKTLLLGIENTCDTIWIQGIRRISYHHAKQFVCTPAEEISPELPNSIYYLNENRFGGKHTKYFEVSEIKTIGGRHFVEDPEDPEAMAYYEILKNESQ